MKLRLFLLATLLFLGKQSVALVFTVEVPQDTKECYIIGVANDWTTFRKMVREGESNIFRLNIPELTSTGGYQYCSGPSWEYEEIGDNGKGVVHFWENQNIVQKWRAIYSLEDPRKGVKITANVPEGTDEVFVLGSYNNWSMDGAIKATKNNDGTFSFVLRDEEPLYELVWSDEFNDPKDVNGKWALPGPLWYFETGGHGWGNNEAQFYVDKVLGNDTVAKIKDGSLIISAIKLGTPYQGKKYISARMNSHQYWTYGRFEMRAKLPLGKGTWPAFWMLPENVQSTLDGEIDIMEHVGYEPGIIYFSVHTGAYTHTLGTGKQAKKTVSDFNSEFHTYAVDWTEDYIAGYIDGECYFVFHNDQKGQKETWPFNVPFNLKLNIAVGGDWGGYEGVDDSIFPATYEIDYVRVYQKSK